MSENLIMLETSVVLAKGIRMDKEYKNVLDYDETTLINLLRNDSHKVYEGNGYSFIRDGINYINLEVSYGDVFYTNYLAFNNKNYKNKWIFAFVDRAEYIAEHTTRIYFTVDIWSTYFKNVNLLPCFVEREHVNDDTIGANTVDEGLAVQEIVANEDAIYDDSLDSDFYIAVASNWNPANETGYVGITAYSKSVFGQQIFLFDLTDSGIYNLEHFLFIVGGQGHTADIHDMFIVPKILVPSGNYTTVNFVKTIAFTEVACSMKVLRYDTTDAYKSITKGYNIGKLHNISGITLKNNKCLCYPFNFLFVSNNIGSSNIYKYEDFNSDTCDFQLQLSLSVGVSGRVVPLAYKGLDENVDESLTLAKYPTCSWSSDSYINWLTQNAVNIGQQFVNTGISAATGNIMTAAGQVASLIGQFYQAQLLPNITGGQSAGDVNFASKNSSFRFMRMHLKKEFLQQIDDYFSKFGYKVNKIKVPNVTGRHYWNYIQIAQSEILGTSNIPHNYMQTINEIARRGTTIWHNHSNIGNFSLNNNIVS